MEEYTSIIVSPTACTIYISVWLTYSLICTSAFDRHFASLIDYGGSVWIHDMYGFA